MKKNISTMVKRACIHEAGHALAAYKFDIPIKYVRLEIKTSGNLTFFDGMTEDEVDKLNEDWKSNDPKAKERAFFRDLTIRWAGIVSEWDCCNLKEFPDTGDHDLQRINERLSLVEERYKGEREEIGQACVECARSIIQENRVALERLANELFKLLMVKRSARIEGQKATEILAKECKPY